MYLFKVNALCQSFKELNLGYVGSVFHFSEEGLWRGWPPVPLAPWSPQKARGAAVGTTEKVHQEKNLEYSVPHIFLRVLKISVKSRGKVHIVISPGGDLRRSLKPTHATNFRLIRRGGRTACGG